MFIGLFEADVDTSFREPSEFSAWDTETDAAVCICDFMARDFKRL